MMKMAAGEGSPPPLGCRNGLLRVATEACGGGTPDLFCSPMVLGYIDIYRRKKSVRGATRGPGGWRARPLPRAFLVASLTYTQSIFLEQIVFWIASVPKITLPKVSFRLDSV